MTANPIPDFQLYGENKPVTQPEFVHIEDIATRSRQHDWVIRPHRHNKMMQLLCLYDGHMQVMLDEHRYELTGNWAVSIPPGCVHGFNFPTETQGVVLTFVESLFNPDEQQQLSPYFNELLRLPLRTSFEADSQLFVELRRQFAQIKHELARQETGYELMLRWTVKTLLMPLKRQMDYRKQQSSDPVNKNKSTFLRFRQLIEQHYREHWPVKQYAGALHISPSTLNRLCLSQSGLTAKATIRNRLMLESKRRLIYTTQSNESIAYTLGFKDPSYFSRFFKQQEGIPPVEYRRIKHAETGTIHQP